MVEKGAKYYITRYYGKKDRHKDSEFEHKLSLQIMGADLAITESRDAKKAERYSMMCSQMKSFLSNIKTKCHKVWDLSARYHKRELSTTWSLLTKEFIDCWEEEMAPENLRMAIY